MLPLLLFRRAGPPCHTPRIVILLTLLLLGTAGTAAAQYVSAGKTPTIGSALPLTAAGDTLLVTYRPNSSIAHTDTLVGTRVWAPKEAGVVRLEAPGGVAQSVSVRFDGVPAQGLFVLIGAGLILFGGAAFAFRKLFEDDSMPVA